jgi:hypothetical protein
LVAVTGAAGIGKSRLAWEFEKYVDGLTAPVRWHSGRCLAYGEGVAFYALAEAIRGRLRLVAEPSGETEAPEDQAALLDAGLAAFAADEGERDWLAPRLGALLGIGPAGQFAREDLFFAWSTFLERVGEGDHPVVLVIEDAQHADDGLAAFLDHLMTSSSFGCFVLLLTRPGMLERRPGLLTGRRLTLLRLDTLGEVHMGALLDGLIPSLPDAARASLIERSEGVPLFAIETVRSLIDRDLVVPRGGQYVLADPGSLDLSALGAPASLHALVAARLDTLTAVQHRVLDLASVLGTSFDKATLAAVGGELEDLDEALADLVRTQLLRQESSRWSAEQGQYQFVQDVVRQVAYGSLSRHDRKAIHLSVVEQLGTGDEIAPIAASHLLAALDAVPAAEDEHELAAAAVDRLRAAAARAGALGAPAEAAEHLGRAIKRARDPGVRRQIQVELALQLLHAGRFEEAIEVGQQVRDECAAAGELVAAGSAAASVCSALDFGRGEAQASMTLAAEWIERLAPLPGAEPVLLRLNHVRTMGAVRAGGEMTQLATDYARLAAAVGTGTDAADSQITLAIALVRIGLHGPSRALLRDAAEQGRQLRDKRVQARALLNLSASSLGVDAEDASAFGEESARLASELGDAGWHSASIVNLAAGMFMCGRWAELASAGFEDVVAGSERPVLDLLFAEIAHARGEVVQPARPALDDLSALFTPLVEARARMPLDAQELEPLVECARAALDMGGIYDDFALVWVTAADICQEAGAVSAVGGLVELLAGHTLDRPPAGARAGLARARAWLAVRDGSSDVVEPWLREAVELAREWRARPFTARCLAELGVWLCGEGRGSEAAPLLEEARATFLELEAAGWSAELANQLAGVPG